MNRYEIDLTGIREKAQIHDRLAAVLPLSEYYGRNLDAFYDELTSAAAPFHIIFMTDPQPEPEIRACLESMKTLCRAVLKELPESTVEWVETNAEELL